MGVGSVGASTAMRETDDSYESLNGMIRHLSTALITTVDTTGIVHTRQLQHAATDNGDDATDLWFPSSRDTPIIAEMRNHPGVVVTYADRTAGRFLVVNGIARIRRDRGGARSRWSPALATWFPGGPGDPAMVLLHVTVTSFDLWE